MAFFGLFKSKQDRAQGDEFNQLLDTIFPGGEENVLRDIERVSRYTHGKIPRDKIRGFVAGCKTLVQISETREDEDFVQSFISRSENLISDVEAYEVFIYLAGEAAYADNITKMLGSKGAPLNTGLIQLLAQMEAIYAEGTYEDSISGGYGEFGLTVTNPIPMISAKGSNNYLSKLHFHGQAVEYARSGSTSSPVTEGKLDIYVLSVDGKEVGTIYICPYHRRNCKTAPTGFTLDEMRDKVLEAKFRAAWNHSQKNPEQWEEAHKATQKVWSQVREKNLASKSSAESSANAQLALRKWLSWSPEEKAQLSEKNPALAESLAKLESRLKNLSKSKSNSAE